MAGIKVTDLPVLGAAAPEDVMYIVDTSTNTSKQIAVEDLNVIPLDGTATGAPITGDLQVKDLDGESFKLFYNDANPEENGLYFLTTDQSDELINTSLICNSNSGIQSLVFANSESAGIKVVNGTNLSSQISVVDGQVGISLKGNSILGLIKEGTDLKIGLFDKTATPSIQSAAIADATNAATAITQLNLLLAAMRAYGLIAE